MKRSRRAADPIRTDGQPRWDGSGQISLGQPQLPRRPASYPLETREREGQCRAASVCSTLFPPVPAVFPTHSGPMECVGWCGILSKGAPGTLRPAQEASPFGIRCHPADPGDEEARDLSRQLIKTLKAAAAVGESAGDRWRLWSTHSDHAEPSADNVLPYQRSMVYFFSRTARSYARDLLPAFPHIFGRDTSDGPPNHTWTNCHFFSGVQAVFGEIWGRASRLAAHSRKEEGMEETDWLMIPKPGPAIHRKTTRGMGHVEPLGFSDQTTNELSETRRPRWPSKGKRRKTTSQHARSACASGWHSFMPSFCYPQSSIAQRCATSHTLQSWLEGVSMRKSGLCHGADGVLYYCRRSTNRVIGTPAGRCFPASSPLPSLANILAFFSLFSLLGLSQNTRACREVLPTLH